MRLEMRLDRPENRQALRTLTHLASLEVVVRGGVEPPTFRFSGGRSYQLSYLTVAWGPILPGRRWAPQASRGPDGI
jgi:hypothetical protein